MPSIAFLSRSSRLPILVFLHAVAPIVLCAALVAQTQQLPYMNAGPNSVFAQIDFARMISDEQAWDATTRNLQTTLIDSGVVSALDLATPDNAMKQYKLGVSAMKGHDSKEAIRFFQKAVKLYPDFVSAHNALGLAYADQQDSRARDEFEIAAKLDDKFPSPFLNLGLLDIAAGDFAGADSNLDKAAHLIPDDPRILVALAFAQNGDHRYAETLQTVHRVHALDHHGYANVHYIAAAAAISAGDLTAAEAQLKTFLSEDPTNPFAEIARQRLEAVDNAKITPREQRSASSIQEIPAGRKLTRITFPNTDYLAAQVAKAATESDDCEDCGVPVEPVPQPANHAESRAALFTSGEKLFTIHRAVDETALFFSVSQHGHTVNDLSLSDIQVRDNNKPPDKILQFIPQSKLPLRLGLLVDTSDSVQNRLTFEKRAAEQFLAKVLTSEADLAFVEGFQDEISVTQDFTRDPTQLAQGIEKLTAGGEGTSIFDAVFFACWKLSAYPDQGRTAKVLLVLTDGQDNSSHRSLQQAIEEAEAAGITVYTVSTSEKVDEDSDANRVLKMISERTGGQAIFPGSLHAFDWYLNQLPRAIRSRYLIAYKAADFRPDGRFRSIRVKVAKAGQHLRVQVRRGYYARSTFRLK